MLTAAGRLIAFVLAFSVLSAPRTNTVRRQGS
jgi:hypothetical protein